MRPRSPLYTLIPALLEREGPRHIQGICKALECDYAAVGPILTVLKRERSIAIVGNAAKWGFKDVKSTAAVYGATVRKAVELVGPATLPKRTRPRTHSGSGVIAERIDQRYRGYFWGAGPA